MRASVSASSAQPCLPCLHSHGNGRAVAAAYAVAACLVAVTFLALAALDPRAQASSWFLSSSSSSSLSSFSSLQPSGGGGASEHLLVTSSSYSDDGDSRNSTGKEVHEEVQVGGDDLLLSLINPSSGRGAPQLSVTPPTAAPELEPTPAALAPPAATVCSPTTSSWCVFFLIFF
jgi:hypothetical protein